MSAEQLNEVIRLLESESLEQRNSAADTLSELGMNGLSTEEGLIALRAATKKFPPRDSDYWDSATDLVIAAGRHPTPDYVPVVVELFSQFNSKARVEAVRLLATIEEPAAAVALMNIMREHARSGGIQDLPIHALQDNPRHANIFFPKILDYADMPAFEWDIYLLCLKYLQAALIHGVDLTPYSARVLESYRKYKFQLRAAQQASGIAWMWEENYRKCREMGCLLLDLFGYFPTPEIEKEIREASTYSDPKIKLFAAISVLRYGKKINPRVIFEVAQSAEVRSILYEELDKLNRSSLFPDEYWTDEASAESNLVRWLAFPTELDRVPDEIELMKIVSIKSESSVGLLDYYVFRFRTNEPHWSAKDGWMAGISGPVPREEVDSELLYGHTFSQFEPWDNKTPEEHLDQILGITSRHNS